MTRTILLVLALAGCAAPMVRQPEVPRIRCVAIGPMPDRVYWLYACTFQGEPPVVLDDTGVFLGGS